MGWSCISIYDAEVEELVTGDEPFDEMGMAINNIIKIYKRKFGRIPYLEELEATFNFCIPEEIIRYTNK